MMTKARRRRSLVWQRQRAQPFVIDFHAHIIVPEVEAWVKANSVPGGVGPRARATGNSVRLQQQQNQIIRSKLTDPKVRLRDMDKMGVDMQVLSVNLSHYCYWTPPEKALDIARTCNERVAEMVSFNPDRFVGIGTVPLPSPKQAAAELKRAVTELGLRGAIISSHAESMELGDRKLDPFWSMAEKLDVPIYVHPAGFSHPERLRNYFLWNSIGQPLEEALAMSSLIYDGAMDRHPRLKLCIAHGGGFLPYYAGRVDRAFEARPETRENITAKPSIYMKRMHYDTTVYNPDMIEFLAQKVGVKRIMMGTDYPVWVAEWDPIGFVKRIPCISSAQRAAILGGNAAKILGLSI
jgi:aminocarboxymuconate-semialdehyde decarboxylase